eukprot:350657-Chlamydomonas_euryale.AAC.6
MQPQLQLLLLALLQSARCAGRLRGQASSKAPYLAGLATRVLTMVVPGPTGLRTSIVPPSYLLRATNSSPLSFTPTCMPSYLACAMCIFHLLSRLCHVHLPSPHSLLHDLPYNSPPRLCVWVQPAPSGARLSPGLGSRPKTIVTLDSLKSDKGDDPEGHALPAAAPSFFDRFKGFFATSKNGRDDSAGGGAVKAAALECAAANIELRRGRGDLDDSGLALLHEVGVTDAGAAAALACLLRRPGGWRGLSADERASLRCAGAGDGAAWDMLARAFSRPGSFGDLTDGEQDALRAAGLTSRAEAALNRCLKRASGCGELPDGEPPELSVHFATPEQRAALRRVFERPGGYADLSTCERALIASLGLNGDAAQACAVRLFERGGAGGTRLSDAESTALAALGVRDAAAPHVTAAVLRVFKRPGGLDEASDDDARTLEAAGVHLCDRAQSAALQRVFRRPGGFGGLQEEDAARLAAAGVDVYDAFAAKAMARLFKRAGDLGDLSPEELDRAAAAGLDLRSAAVMAAVGSAFKRPGGFCDVAEEDGGNAAEMPGVQAAPEDASHSRSCRSLQCPQSVTDAASELVSDATPSAARLSGSLVPTPSKARRAPRGFKLGGTGHADADEDFSGGATAAAVTPQQAEEARRRREMLRAGLGPQYGDHMIGAVEEVALVEGPHRRADVRHVREAAAWGGGSGAGGGSVPAPSVAQEQVQTFDGEQ